MTDPKRLSPVIVHCHACGTEQTVAWTPCSFEALIAGLKAAGKGCANCGLEGHLVMGPRCAWCETRFTHSATDRITRVHPPSPTEAGGPGTPAGGRD